LAHHFAGRRQVYAWRRSFLVGFVFDLFPPSMTCKASVCSITVTAAQRLRFAKQRISVVFQCHTVQLLFYFTGIMLQNALLSGAIFRCRFDFTVQLVVIYHNAVEACLEYPADDLPSSPRTSSRLWPYAVLQTFFPIGYHAADPDQVLLHRGLSPRCE